MRFDGEQRPMKHQPTAQALRRTLALTFAALCLLLSPFAMSAFPRNERYEEFLLAGMVLGLTLSADGRRWSFLGLLVAGSLALAGGLGLRGWPVVGLWACVGGLCYLKTPHAAVTRPEARLRPARRPKG